MAEKFSPAAGSSSQLSAPKPNRPSAIHVIETFLDQRNYKGVARKRKKLTSAAIIWHVSTN